MVSRLPILPVRPTDRFSLPRLELLTFSRSGLVPLIVEPPDLSHPFFQHRNVILTAHVAARTQRAQEAILRTMGHDLAATLEGDQPPRENLVNPEVFLEND